MKKYVAVGIILILIGVNATGSFVKDIEIKDTSPVSFDGNTLYVGGTGPNNYTRIQDAIDNASEGDTVFVYDDSSPYIENLTIDKLICLIGKNKQNTVIEGTIEINYDGVIISNFTIHHEPNGNFPVVHLHEDYCVINNNIIEHGMGIGIYESYCKYNKFSNNTFSGCWIRSSPFGVYSGKSQNSIIENNIITSQCMGIVVAGGEGMEVLNNIIINNGIGIQLYKSNSCNVYNNDVKNCSTGFLLADSTRNRINKNNFINNDCHAVFDNCDIFIHRTNRWFRNYWDNNIIDPRIISGQLFFLLLPYPMGSLMIPSFEIDWFPAKEPYDIGV